MSLIDQQEFAIACPGCKQPLKLRHGDVYNARRTRCVRCSAEIQFDIGVAGNFRSALQEMERAQQKVQKLKAGLLEKAQVKLKMK